MHMLFKDNFKQQLLLTLAYFDEGFVMYYAEFPCIYGDLFALNGEWVYFSNLQSGKYQTVSMPGLSYGIDFNRQ